jgi:programmed cell death 6-interacting protein
VHFSSVELHLVSLSFFYNKLNIITHLACSDSSFERAAVLFNIGALMSAIASSQNTRNDEELKVMTKLFQQAAGLFMKLKESTLDLIQQEPTPDLMPETLTALSALMLAQAQEAIYIKAIKGR